MRGVFVDDKESERQYADHLSRGATVKLTVEFLQPTSEISDFAEQLLSMQLDFVALDFRLDESPITDKTSGRTLNKYRAGALAQQIRDRVSENPEKDVPLILLSQEDFIRDSFQRDATAKDLFDLVISKENLVSKAGLQPTISRIYSVAMAYQILKRQLVERQTISLESTLGLSGQESNSILRTQVVRSITNSNSPHQIAARIRKLFIQKSGFLLSDYDVLARLGISHDSSGQHIDTIFDILSRAGTQYGGVLSEGWRRWWSHRFEQWVIDSLSMSIGSLTGQQRVDNINKKLGLQLSPAVSKWSGSAEELFWVACASCRHPTELRHSVFVYSELHPTFLEPARICWDCVQIGEYEKHNLEIDDSDIVLAEKLKHGKIDRTKGET